MIGIFTRNKGSPRPQRTESTPPPPYEPNGLHDPVFATETTTTTHVVTTTTHMTTTHFFSLPLWRRRGSPVYPPAAGSHSMAGGSFDNLGFLHSPSQQSVLLRDKELPPTPAEDARTPTNEGSHTEMEGPLQVRRDSDMSASTLIRRGSPSPGGESSSVALARAALGLGLPHVMPNSISASSSSSEANAISFIPPPPVPQPSESRTSQSKLVRRAKSFQRESVPCEESAPVTTREHRRMRGLSIGPLHFTSSEKGKEKQREPQEEVHTQAVQPVKTLSRKSSFWSRRRNDSHLAPPAIVPAAYQQPSRPSLPSLQPVSPFYVDAQIPSSPPLHRRHSERTRTTSLQAETGDDPPAIQSNLSSCPRSSGSAFRRSKRPQTADSATSPRRSSFFGEIPQVVTSSPPPMPSPLTRIDSREPVPPPIRRVTRPRASTNPPLLHRLSVNLFGSSTPSPSTSTSAPALAPNMFTDLTTASPTSSPGSSKKSLFKHSFEIPQPRAEEESPEVYLRRLMEAVSKAEIATVLASNPDAFHARALRAYIDQFEFTGDPLDVALRKLLMDVGLPRETQQIDRVIEAFAARYLRCNPNLFISDDHPYILAFSLIMLHTDAFNKSNKRKMTKHDYLKNTRLPGVAQEVLDCFYDNIVFAPFIFIEDPLDVNGHRGLIPEAIIARRASTLHMSSAGGHNSSTLLLGKSTKIDPYYLITRNLLDDLRVNVHSIVPAESPYMYQGTGGPWDEEGLLRAFITASVIEVSVMENRYLSSPWFGLSATGGPGPLFQSSFPLPAMPPPHGDAWTLKVTKVALLLRKEDTVEGGRRAMNRKWREWSVLLTGSQLLFFRDASFAASLQAQIDPSSDYAMFPQAAVPHPDDFLSVKDAVAVYDKSYSKHHHAFRLVMPDGRHFLLQAPNEKEMNEWISRINYASAFKTAGVRMRTLGMSNKDIELTGIAAATSHLRDLQHRASLHLSPRIRTWYGNPQDEVASSSPRDSSFAEGWLSTSPTSAHTSGSEPPTPPMENTSRLFKATFDQVKAELATVNRWRSLDGLNMPPPSRPRAHSLESTLHSPPTSPLSDSSEASRGSSRSEIIRSKLKELEAKISRTQTQLDTDLRLVRNLRVLTPFQRATRDRMQLAVQAAAKRIMQVRLDLEKLVCYRDVLSDDLSADEHNWQWTRKMAMRAATQKLESQGAATVPRMTFSVYLDDAEAPLVSSPMTIPDTASTPKSSHGRDSSFEESFHSALSSGEWSTHPSGSAKVVESAHLCGSPYQSPVVSPTEATNPRLSNGSHPFPDVSERHRASPLVPQSSAESEAPDAEGSHEKFYTAPEDPEEQAEDWNKTRAAKRVSLVRLPPDLRISVLFGKQAYGNGDISEGTDTTPSSPVQKTRNPFDRTESTVDAVAMLDL